MNDPDLPVLSVTCSEISLKGRNRPRFEGLLMRNMRAALKPYGTFELRERGGRILAVSEKDFDTDSAKIALSKVFGIDYVSISMMVEPEIAKMESFARSICARFAGKSIRVETKRSDKRFPMTSQEASSRLGAVFVEAGASVDLKHPDQTIYVDILGDAALMSFEKQKGPAGMPVGSSGKVLSLLSGGIDSPVASWLMMKRGCTVDMLHLHPSAKNADVHDSKIIRLMKKIREYSPCGMRLTIAPYNEFYKKAFKIDHRYEVIVFRRFLFRLASAIARRDGALGIVTGDSIAQVASQTVENIHATDEAAGMPVFRPLVTSNKQETIDIARRIGTYEISLESYKDCCSLISSKSPSTNVPIELARALEGEIGMADIVDKTMAESEAIEL